MMMILINLGVGAVVFLAYWYLHGDRTPKIKVATQSYEVLERSGKRMALRRASRFNWIVGLIYSSLFYFGLPFLIWRYGALRGIGLIALPLGAGLGTTYIVSEHVFNPMSGEQQFLLGSAVLLYLRVHIGVHVAKNDASYRHGALIERSWSPIGFCEARSKRDAIKRLAETQAATPQG
jgi:hypothetical protein